MPSDPNAAGDSRDAFALNRPPLAAARPAIDRHAPDDARRLNSIVAETNSKDYSQTPGPATTPSATTLVTGETPTLRAFASVSKSADRFMLPMRKAKHIIASMTNPTFNPIRLQFIYSYDDDMAMLKLAKASDPKRTRHFWSKLIAMSLGILIAGCVIHSFWGGFSTIFAKDPALSDLQNTFTKWAAIALTVVAIVMILVYKKLTARKTWEKNDKQEVHTIIVSDSGTVLEGATSRVENNWSAYERFAESTDVFLLFISEINALGLPKRVMSAEQIVQLRDLLRCAIGKTCAFPVTPADASR